MVRRRCQWMCPTTVAAGLLLVTQRRWRPCTSGPRTTLVTERTHNRLVGLRLWMSARSCYHNNVHALLGLLRKDGWAEPTRPPYSEIPRSRVS